MAIQDKKIPTPSDIKSSPTSFSEEELKEIKDLRLSLDTLTFQLGKISVERIKVESGQKDKKINSICKFDFVDRVKSKNIDQKNQDLVLELIGIDYLKNKDDYEINLIFNNNAHISLMTETIEVRLEDQSEVK